MLAAALRRIRDPDSSVRSACVAAVRSLAASNPSAVSALLLRPLADALLHEQDHHAQAASALCLAAAVDEADADADADLPRQLQRLVPRLLKLLKSNAFKAKPALISLLGSVAGAGGASTQSLVGMLVPCLSEFLASEDWAARKAAAEALSCVGVTDRDLLGEIKSSCISSFEGRRFDKVKIVRDSMNRMLEVWKDIPAVDFDVGESTPKPQPNSSRRESGNEAVRSNSNQSASPFVARKSRAPVSRSPPPNASPIVTSTRKKNNLSTERRVHPISSRQTSNNEIEELSRNGGNGNSHFEAKRLVFENVPGDKPSKPGGGLKSESNMVPSVRCEGSELIPTSGNANRELQGDHRDADLSLIRRQLLQIETQQSSLLELLQRFMGSSQKGIHSLETRVHGLEKVLDEISHDLAVSSARLSDTDPATTCCSLPGAEFLSPKFWRRTDGGRYSLSSNPPVGGRFLDDHKQRGRVQKSFVVNPLADINPQSRANTDTGIKHTRDG